MAVEGIPYTEIHTVWDKAAPLLQRVLDRMDTGYGIEDIYTYLQLRNMQLWMVDDRAAVVTQIICLPRYKQLHIFLCGGDDAESWVREVIEELHYFKDAHGCKYLTISGRPGWKKLLPEFETDSVNMRCQ